MKRILAIFIVLTIFVSLAVGTYAESLTLVYDGEVHNYDGYVYAVKINGEQVKSNVPSVILENCLMIPLRAVCEKLGAVVEWDGENYRILVKLNSDEISMAVNDNAALVNGKQVVMEQPVKIMNDTAMIPADFLIKSFNLKSQWYPDQQYLMIEKNSIEDIKWSEKGDYLQVEVFAGNCSNYSLFTLSSPDRIVLDLPNTVGPSPQQTISVNSKILKAIRYSQYEKGTARVVLDLVKETEYKTEQKDDRIVITVYGFSETDQKPGENNQQEDQNSRDENIPGSGQDNEQDNQQGNDSPNEPNPSNNGDEGQNNNQPGTGINMPGDTTGGNDAGTGTKNSRIIYEKSGDVTRIVLEGIKLYNYDGDMPKKLFTEMKDASGKVYIITFPSTLSTLENGIIKLEDSMLNSIQIINVEKNQSTSIVFTAKDKLEYNVLASSNSDSTVIIAGAEGTVSRGDEVVTTPYITSADITYKINERYDEVAIHVPGYKDYTVTELSNPERIVLDITNVKAPLQQQTINVNGGAINTIRYAQLDSKTARVVLDISASTQYTVIKNEAGLTVRAISPVYGSDIRNITYRNSGNVVNFILNKVALTDGGSDLKKFYSASYDSTGLKYTITFPSSLGDLGSGIMQINDSVLNNIRIIQNKETNETSITFDAKDKFVYEIFSRYDNNGEIMDTAITVLKPATKADKLVVIDPGHGGSDPGAVYSGVKEKDINLDIALRLYDLLKSRGVNAYIIRDDDSFVGLYERAYIANSLNATLFLSIHNNAFNTKAYGTETLYYPSTRSDSGFNGQRFATIIQNKLVSSLGTLNRGIIERPGLVVLKATKMTAALAEVSFLDNDSDRQNLLSEDFRQRAAEALCEAVIQSLSEIN